MSTTVYTWNPLTDSVIEESDGSGNVLCTYTNEPSQFGPLISENRGGTTSYYHADVIGSTRLTTNSSQTVVDSFLFDAWGNTVASSEPTTTPYQWCGRNGNQSDTTRGIAYVRSRTYVPALACWLSVDPPYITSPESVPARQPFGYGLNSPVTFTDHTGNDITRISPTAPPLNVGPIAALQIDPITAAMRIRQIDLALAGFSELMIQAQRDLSALQAEAAAAKAAAKRGMKEFRRIGEVLPTTPQIAYLDIMREIANTNLYISYLMQWRAQQTALRNNLYMHALPANPTPSQLPNGFTVPIGTILNLNW